MTIAIMVFVFPLLDIHNRIQAKKEMALEENGEIIQQTIDAMHARLAAKKLKASEDFNHGISGLTKVRDEIAKISPWPWESGTLRAFLSAILLPVILIVIQQLISRMM